MERRGGGRGGGEGRGEGRGGLEKAMRRGKQGGRECEWGFKVKNFLINFAGGDGSENGVSESRHFSEK